MNDKPIKLNAQISEEAAEWLVEFRTGDVDAAGRRTFDTWVRSSPEHLRAYLETAAIWNEGSALDAQRELETNTLVALARAAANVVPFDAASTERHFHDEVTRSPVSALATEAASTLLARENLQDGADSQAVMRSPSPPAAYGTKPSRSVSPRRLAIAASTVFVSVAVGASLWFKFFYAPTYTTAVGEERTLKLSDGSTVELNSRSRLRVRFSQNQRDVDLLEGQALFKVAKDHARPFIVASDGTRVRAVGTQFDVYRKLEGTVVTVLEGHVAVTTAEPETPRGSPSASIPDFDPRTSNSDAAFLSAGEQATLTPRATPKPIRANVASATAWTQHQLVLDSAPLTDVAEEFNRYSTRKLIVEDSGNHPLRLSGVFSTDPDFLIRYLRDRPDISMQETDSEIHINHHD